MRKTLSAGLLLGAATMLAPPVAATPFNSQSFSNVVIAGTSYTVSFFDLAFLNLTAAQQVPSFTTESEASAALSAIMSAPGYAALAALASNPTNSFTSVVVPFSAAFARNASPSDTAVVYRGLGAVAPAPVAGASNFELDANVNYDFNPAGITLATFAVVGVPEPGSFAVLALGLFGLGWGRRRFM